MATTNPNFVSDDIMRYNVELIKMGDFPLPVSICQYGENTPEIMVLSCLSIHQI
jgi:hypothetical protein